MNKKIITICFIAMTLVVSCSVDSDEKKAQSVKESEDQNNFDENENEDFYFNINDQYDTEEVDYSEEVSKEIILPGEYNTGEGDYNEENVKDNYNEDVDDFNLDVYKGIINDINNILKTNNNRTTTINNLRNFEVTTFEILYTMHNSLYELSEKKKKEVIGKISEDPLFVEFLKRAPSYAESTIIAEIFQTISFISKNIENQAEADTTDLD